MTMTFIQVLNNPEYRRMVDAIEDTTSSLRAYPDGDPTLQRILTHQVDELFKATGFKYDIT